MVFAACRACHSEHQRQTIWASLERSQSGFLRERIKYDNCFLNVHMSRLIDVFKYINDYRHETIIGFKVTFFQQ